MTVKNKYSTTLVFIVLVLCTNFKLWSQSSDLIVYPTLTFYSTDAPTVADLVVREQNIAGTIVWYNQKVGGTAYNPTDLLDVNQSYWAELLGTSINERLQTKIYFADTPVINPGDGINLNSTNGLYYACEGQDFTLIGDNLGGIEEFEATLTSLGFMRLNTGLNNNNVHFISNSANTWEFYNELINGDPNNPTSVGTPGVSFYMLNDTDLNTNRTERDAVWNAVVAQGLGANYYWLGLSQFLNSADYMGFGGQAQAEAGWFWEDGTYYNIATPIDPDGRDWGTNEPNDYGTGFYNLEEDKLQIRNNEWIDQVGNSLEPARQSGAIIEFNDASGIQWYRNDGSGWVSIVGATGSELVQTAGAAGTSIDYRVDATFNGSTQSSTAFTVHIDASPNAFNIVDNDDTNNPNEEFFVCNVGESQGLKTDFLDSSLNYTWTAIPSGVVNLTPTANTVLVEGVSSGSVIIEAIATNSSGCEYRTSITFEVGGLTAPALPSPMDVCGRTGLDLPTTDNNGQDIAWYATGDNTTELSGNNGTILNNNDSFDVYSVIRDITGNVVCQSTSNSVVSINLPYALEPDPTLPDPNNGNPGPMQWSLSPMTPGGNYDLRNLGSWSPVGSVGTNRYYTLFRGIDPNTLPEAPYDFRVYRNSDFTNRVNAGIQNYVIGPGNPDIVYATIQPNGFDCIFQFGPIYLRECNLMDLGNEITGGNEICGIGSTIQLNADVTNLPAGYTILWTATPETPAGNITFDNATAATVNITSTAIGNISISYTVTDPSGTECETTTANPYVVSIIDQTVPTFSQAPSICEGDNLTALPTISNEGISGTWSPALDNANTTTYTFTPNTGQCASLASMTIVVNPVVTPTFPSVAPICEGDNLGSLPTSSNEGITGTWSPGLDNMNTTTYTFTPDAGQCSTTGSITITVNQNVTPTFTQVTPICEGDNLGSLPTSSNEGITGTWSPSLNNMNTTTYIFTPDAGQCATTGSMVVTVNQEVIPTFAQVAPICEGDNLTDLPTTSNEGIIGTWSPALNNMNTTTYTFTPDAGQCATTGSIVIVVNQEIIPTFTQVAPICDGDNLAPLPTTSNEGITGTWSPSIDNANTTTYTFTPNPGECSSTQTMTITVNSGETPMFNLVAPICEGDFLSPLPTVSLNGITGSWNPELNNTVTTTYTFSPDPGFCPSSVSLTIEVNPLPILSLEEEYFLCVDDADSFVSADIIDTGLNTPRYNFIWYRDGIELINVTEGSYTPLEAGVYDIIIEDTSSNAMPFCQSFISTTVNELKQPIVQANVTTDAFSKNHAIEVTVLNSGDMYEYSLDGGPWQESPIFSNVSIGSHSVSVRDTRGCLEGTDSVVVMGYPRYFTPNGDGFNETWNITAPRSPVDYLASAKIQIFDRYGKLLKELDPAGIGWNGTYNGSMMNSDDYWFVVDYIEPRTGESKTYRAHFTLKR